jgi:hypothetical protein
VRRTGVEDEAEGEIVDERSMFALPDGSPTTSDVGAKPVQLVMPESVQDALPGAELPPSEQLAIEHLCGALVTLSRAGERDKARQLAEFIASLLGAPSAEREPVRLATVSALRLPK